MYRKEKNHERNHQCYNCDRQLVLGWPILIIMIGGGLYLTFRCGFVQIRRFGYICSQTFGKMFQKAEKGKISSFGAACAALGSTIGSSNIVGGPVAIALGGPGAVFWM